MRCKLVRDNIPEITAAQGKEFRFTTASKEEMLSLLTNKLQEETFEFTEDNSAEELADILEVVLNLAAEIGIDENELFEIVKKKRERNGGFSRRVVMELTP